MTPADILISARALIADKDDWAEGRLYQGTGTTNGDIHIRYCALGALHHSDDSTRTVCRCLRCLLARDETSVRVPSLSYKAAWLYLQSATETLFGHNHIPYVNDNLGHDAILALYDYAIKLAESEES